ncbi:hypothetical protein DITRI_Ditri16bG0085600 [Diplodiscus trichospermus]
MMSRIVEKREFCTNWKHKYGPLVKQKINVQKKEGVDWHVVWNGNNGCEVKKGRRQYVVNLIKKECTCRLWQISGILCAHAYCAIWHDEGEPDDFLHKMYNPQMYMKAYQYSFQLINGPHEWKKSNLDPIIPPPTRKTAERPKKSRRKVKDEPKKTPGKLSKAGLEMTYKLCGEKGHNK